MPATKTFEQMTGDEKQYVCEHRDEFPHLDAEVKAFFKREWDAIHEREDERAARYPDDEEGE